MLFYRWYQGYFWQKFQSLIENRALPTGQVFRADKRLHYSAIILKSPCYSWTRYRFRAEQNADSGQKAAPQNFLLMCYDESS